jgi:hypothetical protein
MGIIIVNWCCMYKSNEEMVDHLFFHCEIARELWSLILCSFGVIWVILKLVKELLSCWQEHYRNHNSADMCLMWSYGGKGMLTPLTVKLKFSS